MSTKSVNNNGPHQQIFETQVSTSDQNPAKLVQTPQLPIKTEFSLDQTAHNPNQTDDC